MADELDIPMPSMMPASSATWRNARRRESLDSSTRRLVLFAGVIGGGLLLLVGAWSLTGHRSAAVPVVEADSRPLRSKPDNPGGMQLTGQDDANAADTAGQDGTAPPPEIPAPQALQQAAQQAAQQAEAAAAKAVTAAADPAATPPAAPVSLAAPSPAPAATSSAVSAVPEHDEPAAKPAPAAASVALPPRVVAGPQVQLAALVSEEAAKTEWQRLMHRMPELLGGRSPSISRLDRSDGKVFWRLRTSGFPDAAQATSFCEKVRAKGNGCSLGGN